MIQCFEHEWIDCECADPGCELQVCDMCEEARWRS